MDKRQARMFSNQPQPTQSNLAEQPYLYHINQPESPDDQAVDPSVRSPAAEDVLTPRAGGKRKSTKSKPRSAKSVSLKALRSQGTVAASMAEELAHLEELAERLNQLMAARAQKRSRSEQAAASVEPPPPPAPRLQPEPQSLSTDDAEVAAMRRQADLIRRRLAELEAAMNTAGEVAVSTPVSPELSAFPDGWLQPFAPPPVPSSSQMPLPPSNSASAPAPSTAQQESVQTAEALRYLAHRQRGAAQPPGPHLGELRRARSGSRSRRSGVAGWFHRVTAIPAKPIDRLGDAALWVVLAAVVRVSLRVVLMSSPALMPLVLVLSLAPALLAAYLAFCVPSVGAPIIYRLVLITLGLLLGSKL